MKILHSNKSSKIPTAIPIEASAVEPSSFYHKFVRTKGQMVSEGLVWKLTVQTDPNVKGRHDGHVYEIVIEDQWIDALTQSLQTVKSGILLEHLTKVSTVDEELADEEDSEEQDDD